MFFLRKLGSLGTKTHPGTPSFGRAVRAEILRQQGTEPPGSHAYDRFMPTKVGEGNLELHFLFFLGNLWEI